MAKSRNVLGRGLSALIPESEEDLQSLSREIDLSQIENNPFQPRKDFSPEEIHGLSRSIKENGLLQPIIVRKKEDHYEVISGERRLRAFKELKRSRIPAIIKDDVTDEQMLSMALVENIQRENLNEIEEAHAFQVLLTRCGFTHEQLAGRLGKSRSVITNTLRLLQLPEFIQKQLIAQKINMGHARALLSLSSAKEMEQLCKRIIEENLPVREVESICKIAQEEESGQKAKKKSGKTAPKKEDADMAQLQEDLRYALGTKVNILDHQGKGKIEIEYFGVKDLNRICDLLLRARSSL